MGGGTATGGGEQRPAAAEQRLGGGKQRRARNNDWRRHGNRRWCRWRRTSSGSTGTGGGISAVGRQRDGEAPAREAAAAVPTKLAFVTAPQTVVTGTCSQVVTIETRARRVMMPVTGATAVTVNGLAPELQRHGLR